MYDTALARAKSLLAQVTQASASLIDAAITPREKITPYDWFANEDALTLVQRRPPEDRRVDQRTWLELRVEEYLAKNYRDLSITGRQAAALQLCIETPDTASPISTADQLASFGGIPDSVEVALRKLRAISFNGAIVFMDGCKAPNWLNELYWVPWFSCFLSVLLFTPLWPWALALTGLMVVVCGSVTINLYEGLTRWNRSRICLATVLQVAHELLQSRSVKQDPLTLGLDSLRDEVATCRKRLNTSLMSSFPGASDFLNLFTLHEILDWHRVTKDIEAIIEDVHCIYIAVGNIELRAAVYRQKQAIGNEVCAARIVEAGPLTLDGMRSPLLPHASPLTVSLSHGAVLTGKNGAGKSTFLRGLGLNCLLGLGFGYCYSKSACLPIRRICTSLEVKEDSRRGLSFYMAELDRAASLLRDAEQSPSAYLMLFDEIFRGTNFLESTAAGAGVVMELLKDSKVIVSTHNLALVAVLSRKLATWALRRDSEKASLEPYVEIETNGLAMMRQFSFDPRVLAVSDKVAHWLTGYLTYPAFGPELDGC